MFLTKAYLKFPCIGWLIDFNGMSTSLPYFFFLSFFSFFFYFHFSHCLFHPLTLFSFLVCFFFAFLSFFLSISSFFSTNFLSLFSFFFCFHPSFFSFFVFSRLIFFLFNSFPLWDRYEQTEIGRDSYIDNRITVRNTSLERRSYPSAEDTVSIF